MFGRRRREDAAAAAGASTDGPEGVPRRPASPPAGGIGNDAAVEVGPGSGAEGPLGPYDAESVPDDGVERIDLGSLLVPQVVGVELRLEVAAATPPIITAVTLATAGSMLQLSAFSAPRSQGIWEETRTELAEAHRQASLPVEEGHGEFGPELRAQVPTGQPGQVLPVRMVAVEGPRWLLRGNFIGAAALDPAVDRALLRALRLAVVVRGRDAMAVGELLPLRPPPGVTLPPMPDPAAPPDPLPPGPGPLAPGSSPGYTSTGG